MKVQQSGEKLWRSVSPSQPIRKAGHSQVRVTGLQFPMRRAVFSCCTGRACRSGSVSPASRRRHCHSFHYFYFRVLSVCWDGLSRHRGSQAKGKTSFLGESFVEWIFKESRILSHCMVLPLQPTVTLVAVSEKSPGIQKEHQNWWGPKWPFLNVAPAESLML